MVVIFRIFMMILGYALACVAAALVLTLGTMAGSGEQVGSQAVVLWAVVAVLAAFIAVMALLPTLLVVVLAEGFAWRSILIYGVLGGVLALALYYGGDLAGYVSGPAGTFTREREVLAASGIAGGLVYWLFAGRRAGSWK